MLTRKYAIEAVPMCTRLFVVALLCGGLSGCSLLQPTSISNVGKDYQGPTITVELRPLEAEPTRGKLAWKEGMLVQHALLQSQAPSRFDDMSIMVKRRTSDVHRTIPMPSKFDRTRRTVKAGYDYALHQGDYIILTEKSASFVDKIMGVVLGDLDPEANQ